MAKSIKSLKEEIGKNLLSVGFNKVELDMNIIELEYLIDQLEEPNVSNETIKDILKANKEMSKRIKELEDELESEWWKENGYVVTEKPIIPKFVADWIDTHNLYGNNPLREYHDLENDFNEGWTNEEGASVYHWINKNPYVFIDALRYGYEVEKEKLYTVCFEDDKNVYRTGIFLYKDGEVVNSGNAMYKYDKKNSEMHLTEKEIKDYDDRFWQFAEEVEE